MVILRKISHFVRFFEIRFWIKFLSLSILMFLILLNQNLIRNVSTSLIVTQLGTQSISFIKLLQFPLGLGFMLLNIKLMNIITSEQIFRIVTIFFLTFFALFAFVVFPNTQYFHPTIHRIESLIVQFPHLKWFFLLWQNWCYALLFSMSDLWPVVISSLLFWQLANKINSVKEAATLYVPMGIISQSNMIVSSGILSYFLTNNHFLMNFFHESTNDTEKFLQSVTLVIIFTGIIILILHRYIEVKNIDSLSKFRVRNKRIDILKYGIVKSLRLIFSSKYLILAFWVTISYSVCVNLIEGIWFSRVKALHTSVENFSQYQANVLLATSIVALFCTIVGSFILKYFGWFSTVSISPFMFLIFGTPFFIFTILDNRFVNLQDILGVSSGFLLQIIIIFSSLQNILGKGSKYSLYDASKEMVYIPLDDELKNKGKIAVTILGVQLGKSFGTIIQFLSFTFFPNATHEDIGELLFILFFITCILWIFGLKYLSVLYHQKQKIENS